MIWNFHLANTRRQGKRKEKSKGDSGIDPSLNAVSYLQCMMNMRKEEPPVYTLKADAGPTQKGLMRFQIEVPLYRGFAQIVKLRKFAAMMEENIRIVRIV